MPLLYETESYSIRGAIFEVYKALGSGHKEVVYQRALEQALVKQGLKVEREKRLSVVFDGKIVGTYTPDFLINGLIILELKAKPFVTSHDLDQFWHYLAGSNFSLGFLINFGKPGGVEIMRRVYESARQKIPRLSATSSASFRDKNGFTLMEIVVATTIFALVSAAMMALFNYTLQINRRSEALRQATQGMRDFVEFLVKDIRNGQVDYGLVDPTGNSVNPVYPAPCTAPVVGADTYAAQENKLAIVNVQGDEECVYLAYGPGAAAGNTLYSYVGNGVFANNTNPADSHYNPNAVMALKKNALAVQTLSPPNFRIEKLMFYIRPTKDPYTQSGGYAKVQPFVTINIKFVAQLPTGEQVPIFYQTSVSTSRYDVPNQ